MDETSGMVRLSGSDNGRDLVCHPGRLAGAEADRFAAVGRRPVRRDASGKQAHVHFSFIQPRFSLSCLLATFSCTTAPVHLFFSLPTYFDPLNFVKSYSRQLFIIRIGIRRLSESLLLKFKYI